MTLQYDKLYVDNAVYIFNEDIDSIELLNVAEIEAEYRRRTEDPKGKGKGKERGKDKTGSRPEKH